GGVRAAAPPGGRHVRPAGGPVLRDRSCLVPPHRPLAGRGGAESWLLLRSVARGKRPGTGGGGNLRSPLARGPGKRPDGAGAGRNRGGWIRPAAAAWPRGCRG